MDVIETNMRQSSLPHSATAGVSVRLLIEQLDWSASPLGVRENWPQSLRSVVDLMLGSRFPMFVAWGTELALIYNDAYAEILGAKHPAAFGSRFQDVWREIWSDISPLIETALEGGATYHENLPLIVTRRGFDEQAWFTFSYSPVRDEAGAVAGMFATVAETTLQVLNAKTLRETAAKESFLVALGDSMRPMRDPLAIVAATTQALGEHLGASRVVYSDIGDDGTTAFTEGDWTDGTAAHLPHRINVSDFGSEIIDALRTGQTLTVPDVTTHPTTANSLPALAAIDVGGLVSVPLIKEGNFAANLNVHSRTSRAWTDAEIDLIEAVAERTWDVLARARAVRALEERGEELRTLTDALPVLISYVDRDERYRYNNKAYEDWFGRNRDELYGKHIGQVIGEAAYAALKPKID